MTSDQRMERLEHILGTLIGSLWADGTLDRTAKIEMLHLLDSDHWPPTKPTRTVAKNAASVTAEEADAKIRGKLADAKIAGVVG